LKQNDSSVPPGAQTERRNLALIPGYIKRTITDNGRGIHIDNPLKFRAPRCCSQRLLPLNTSGVHIQGNNAAIIKTRDDTTAIHIGCCIPTEAQDRHIAVILPAPLTIALVKGKNLAVDGLHNDPAAIALGWDQGFVGECGFPSGFSRVG